jgi:hypothetical protein
MYVLILTYILLLLYPAGLIKCLFATETFSIGINMPAKTVVFTSTRKFDGKDFRWITSGQCVCCNCSWLLCCALCAGSYFRWHAAACCAVRCVLLATPEWHAAGCCAVRCVLLATSVRVVATTEWVPQYEILVGHDAVKLRCALLSVVGADISMQYHVHV